MNTFASYQDHIAMMREIDLLVSSPQFEPYHGWHNERLVPDRAAFQQDRREFVLLLNRISLHNALMGSCLQLGMGPSGASHRVWRKLFNKVVTIDLALCAVDGMGSPGMNTHSHEAWLYAQDNGPFDFLFIDAGHSFEDVSLDYALYQLLVRKGGVIAFHDALERPGYPEVKVHEFIKSLPVTVFGTEVGTAVMVKGD